ncbi:11346_t:CDS:2 [Gigaspora margarita]|uniref:11346_t:CDS:1 n=1 Tax=Gigaspora margarita TaxID=4874 RepID=A0ABN7VRG9_GIGMA|nr:11346_t:CDS:2 [Gigaspora margarita]
MVNAQEYLDKNYPKEVRGKLTELLISNKNLEGDLDLSDFVNLKELDCSRNKLNSLKVNNCLELKNIGCHYNQLTDLDVSNSSQLVRADCGYNLLSNITLPNNTTNLKELDLHNNKFPSTQSLSFLFPYTNLVFLYIGNDGEYGVYIKNLTGQEVIEKFIRQQQLRGNIEELFKNGQYIFFKSKQQDKKLKWIPYEEFADIEYLAEGGFGKIYKARGFGKIYKAVCKREKVVLKTLNDFCAITPTFLTEVANTKLVESQETVESQAIVSCLGISQDPKTKNYIMVMDYMSEGEIRDKKNTHFHQQYQLLEAEYNQAIQNNPYQIDSNAVTTSKMINTKLITKQLKKLKFDKEYRTKALDELTLENLNLDELVIDEDPQKQSSHQAQIQIPPK